MHYKDGTPAILGDIVQHDNGSVGIVIGGTIGNDTCSTHVVSFKSVSSVASYGPIKVSTAPLRDATGKIVAQGSVVVSHDGGVQTREMLKIGHVDIGHG